MSRERQLRDSVKDLLRDKKVGAVVGHVRGSVKGRSRPAVVRTEAEAERLVFDRTCGINLARYAVRVLRAQPGTKVGVVAKGCDGRALLQYVAEGQLKRDDVLIVGIACDGVLDPVRAADGVLSASCRRCESRLAPACDLAFDQAPATKSAGEDRFTAVAEFEKLTPAERWQHFEREFAKCTRCNACRNSCPMCYCEECFADQTAPRWFGASADLTDMMLFHVVRALHVAGRCVDCGACERACPRGVRLTLLNQRLDREVRERFGYTPGLDPEAKPALATFNEDDKQEFIL